jgi:hypothetical protein
MGKAHYYRGLTHRRLGQPGQAITDLTRALEYGGLTDTERTDAESALQGAYQEAGISPNEKVIVAKPSEEELRPPAKSAAAPAPSPVKVTEPVRVTEPPTKSAAAAPSRVPDFGATIVTGSLQGEMAAAAAGPAQAWHTSTAAAPVPEAKPTPQQKSTAVVPVLQAKPLPQAKPSTPAQSQPNTRSSAWTSQQVALAPLPPVPVQPKKSAAAEKKQPAASVAPFVTEVAAAPQPVAPAEVRLLVGETRTRNEAIALAVRLTSQRGAQLGPRRPQIAETRLADTQIYHVRLGPFTDPMRATSLCRSLRDSGYDCVAE